jgi:pimeloyl-ACP methyl ester carboxylesterase
LAFDHRGHGNSETGDFENLGIDIHFDDFKKILEYYNYNEIILIGASFGGVLANRYTIAYPGRVKKLIVISTTPETSIGMNNALVSINKSIDDFIQADCNIKKLDPQSMKLLSIFMKIHSEKPPYNKLRFLRFFIDKFQKQNFSLLEAIQKNITCPVLILHGDIDYVEVENAKKMHSFYQNSQLVIIPQFGHLPQRKNPQLVEKYISKFLLTS